MMCLPEQLTLTGEQHWPGLQCWLATSTHCCPSGHPPLSQAHEFTQYGSPVSSHVLHFVPGGHGRNKHAMVIKIV